MSTCGKCGNHTFKTEVKSPSGSTMKVVFVQCASCGVPVGVMDYFSVGSLLKDQEKAIENIRSRLAALERAIAQLARR